jgi:DNA-binding winged helix-turn-helix (wHTH) protein
MPGESDLTNRICFGEVTLDCSSAEIELNGVRQRLPDQAFQVLELLVTRPGQLVTREELIARLWPRTTYIDTEAGLNTAVRKLRAALGDDADHPRYVETAPRRGYRFIAGVERERSTVARDSPPVVWRR